MATKIDLDEVESQTSEVGSTGRDGDNIDWEGRYRGLSKKYTKLEKQFSALQDTYDQALVTQEELSGKVRNASKDSEASLKDLKSQLEVAQKQAAQFEGKFKALEAREAMRNTINTKYPQLSELYEAGDLRESTSFEKPEDYDAYLQRMASKLAPVAPQQVEHPQSQGLELTEDSVLRDRRRILEGAVPSINLASRTGNSPRTIEQIQEDMWKLDVRAPDYKQKSDALIRELDMVLR